jgi:hypothetical protein
MSEMRGISLFDLLSTFVFGAVNAITYLPRTMQSHKMSFFSFISTDEVTLTHC